MLKLIINQNVVTEKLENIEMIKALLSRLKLKISFPPLNTEAVSNAFYQAFIRYRH